MAETITVHHGSSQWNWSDVWHDLETQGGLKEIIIDPLTMSANGCAGSFQKNPFYLTWIKDVFMLLSMKVFSQQLVDAFSAVVEYQPFCRYTEENDLITVEWDKKDPAKRFKELEVKGHRDFQRLSPTEPKASSEQERKVETPRTANVSVAPGIVAALTNRSDNRAYFTFDGDLNQMGIIYSRLLDAGFPVVKSGVYPGFPRVQEGQYSKALRFLYESKTEGWWNQERNLVQYSICTQEEFDRVLGRKPVRL